MTFSDHFKLSFKTVLVFALMGLGIFLWIRHGVHDVFVPKQAVLPPMDKEIVSYDEDRHMLSMTTDKGTTRTYSREPEVEVRKDGTVKVSPHAWGTETRPFLGVGYSDAPRGYVGCQLFYFHQFDAAASFGWTPDNRRSSFQPTLSLAWNFWSNSSMNVGTDPVSIILQQKPSIALFLSVRI